ncbi:MAG: hypothetical protein ACRC67_39630 [Inquilinus sp.]|uniref:hypothetical protein n=1 Tax=Inquilinus sp. TaxID=1932117 RepID=UPI003F33A652
MVAHLSGAEIANFVPTENFVLPSGAQIEPTEFIAETEAARARGCAVTNKLVDRFTRCPAAPVVDHDAPAVTALCLATRWTRRRSGGRASRHPGRRCPPPPWPAGAVGL